MKKKLMAVLFVLLFSLCVCSAAFAQVATHKVTSGETFYGIAKKYQISVAELQKANPQIKDISKIYVGQGITIPENAPLKTLEDEVVRLCNLERSKYGLGPLTNNGAVAAVARKKSQDMIDKKYFAHQSPTYGSPFNMMESFGLRFSAAAENIAYGQRTAADVVNSWMNSPGHRANILSKQTTDLGVGAAKAANGTLYWTQMFIKPLK